MKQLRGDSGQSLVEFALVVPTLVFILFSCVYLNDLVFARLRTHEVARYVAFTMAKQPLSDYATGKHDQALTAAEARVLDGADGARTLYAGMESLYAAPDKILHSAALNGTLSPIEGITVTSRGLPGLPTDTLTAAEGALGASPVVQLVLGLIAGGINSIADTLIADLGFNAKQPMLTARVTSVWTIGGFIPAGLERQGGFSGPLSHLSLVTLRDSVTILADPWALGDGRDVRTPGYLGHDTGTTEAALHTGLKKMIFLNGLYTPQGISQLTTAMQDLTAVLSGSAPGFGPFDAKVSSFSYVDPSAGTPTASCDSTNPSLGCIDVFKANGAIESLGGGQVSVHGFDTTQMRDRFGDPSPNVEAYQRRGNNYMGCPQDSQHNCSY